MKTAIRVLTAAALLLANDPRMNAADTPSLKDVCQGRFLVGAAINDDQCTGTSARAQCEDAIIAAQFNACTPENVLKWEAVQPEANRYDFAPADRYVAFGERNHMFIVGHNLVWHFQTPDWVFKDAQGNPITRDALLQRMHDHIATVVGRYKGRIKAWDVVNEAVDLSGELRKTEWLKIIGEDYLIKAYQFAHEADPDAELYYNEYDMEYPAKRAGAIALVKKLQAAGIPVAGIGIQGHYKMDFPSVQEFDDTITELHQQLGVKVMITELDIDTLPRVAKNLEGEIALARSGHQQWRNADPYPDALPPEMQEKLAARYADLFKVILKHKEVARVTFWGVTDTGSWLNTWPVKRSNYPLLFGRDCKPKPAFDAVVKTIEASR